MTSEVKLLAINSTLDEQGNMFAKADSLRPQRLPSALNFLRLLFNYQCTQ